MVALSLLMVLCRIQVFEPRRAGPFWLWGIIVLAIPLAYRVFGTWASEFEINGAFITVIGRVISRFGFGATHGFPYIGGGTVFDSSWVIYNHHPPGVAWIAAVLFMFLGVHEWVVRLIPMIAMLTGVMAVMFRLGISCKRSFGPGFLVVSLACPAFTYYGRMVNYEPVCLGIGMTLIALADWRIELRGLTWGLATLVFLLPWLGWVGIPMGVVCAFFIRPRIRAPMKWLIVLIPLFSAVLVLIHAGAAYPGGWREMVKASAEWTYLAHPTHAVSFGYWIRFAQYRAGRAVPLGLLVLLVFMPAFLRGAELWMKRLLWLGLGILILSLVVMPRAMLYHDYHWMWLWPPLALLGGYAVKSRAIQGQGGPVYFDEGPPRWQSVLAALLMAISVVQGYKIWTDLHRPNLSHQIPEIRSALEVRDMTTPQERVLAVSAYGFVPITFLAYVDRNVVRIEEVQDLSSYPDARILVIFTAQETHRRMAEQLNVETWQSESIDQSGFVVYKRRPNPPLKSD